MHDASDCPICRGLPIDGSMSDEQFDRFLQDCNRELAEKQAAFNAYLAPGAPWSYDLHTLTMQLGDRAFPITPVGSHSPQYETWLWAWANDDYPAPAREASRQLQSLHDHTGFKVFINKGIAASTLDAQDFTACAVHVLGAIGFFRAPSTGPTLYLAVHAPACGASDNPSGKS